MKEGMILATVGGRCWLGLEFQGEPSLLRRSPRSGRVVMTGDHLNPAGLFTETMHHVPAQCVARI